MQANNPSHTVYVAGMTANLLLSYLDQQGLAVSELREKLTRLASLPRMPITHDKGQQFTLLAEW